jgi:uncharacterized protein (DUF2147 family)
MREGIDMKWILTVAVMLSLGFATMANAAGIDGQWARGDGNAKVRIAPCGSNICATNTWIKPGTPSEKAGDILTMTIKPVSDGGYSGTAFDPQRNLTYKISVNVKGDTMTTRGCVLAGLLCKDVNWARIN